MDTYSAINVGMHTHHSFEWSVMTRIVLSAGPRISDLSIAAALILPQNVKMVNNKHPSIVDIKSR